MLQSVNRINTLKITKGKIKTIFYIYTQYACVLLYKYKADYFTLYDIFLFTSLKDFLWCKSRSSKIHTQMTYIHRYLELSHIFLIELHGMEFSTISLTILEWLINDKIRFYGYQEGWLDTSCLSCLTWVVDRNICHISSRSSSYILLFSNYRLTTLIPQNIMQWRHQSLCCRAVIFRKRQLNWKYAQLAITTFQAHII